MTDNDLVINMDKVVAILRDRGVDAFVEMTGGGCATIYAGQPNDERYAAVAGPGTYRHREHGFSVGHLGEFVMGPDSDDDGVLDCADVGAVTEEQIADLIQAQATKPDPTTGLSADEVERLGLDPSGRSTPRGVVEQRARAQRYVGVWNAALHAAYAEGADPNQATAAAKKAVDEAGLN